MTVDLVALVSVLAGGTVVAGGLVAGFLRVRKWVAGVAVSTQEAGRQLQTSNGKTVGDYVEDTARDIGDMKGSIAELSNATTENRETSIAALTLARHLNERFDSHLVNDHGALRQNEEE